MAKSNTTIANDAVDLEKPLTRTTAKPKPPIYDDTLSLIEKIKADMSRLVHELNGHVKSGINDPRHHAALGRGRAACHDWLAIFTSMTGVRAEHDFGELKLPASLE